MNLKCKTFGHKWDKGQYKKYCKRKGCHIVKNLVENKYPKIGEPKYEWKILDISDLNLR